MTPNKNNVIKPESPGFFKEIGLTARLIWRLLQDPRVNVFSKMLPVGSLLYLFNPFDIPTPLDDAAIIWLCMTLFIELCPQDVVEEHRTRILNEITEFEIKDEVIEGEFIDLGDDFDK